MKRSRNIVLTLLLPAVAAFGCSQSYDTVHVPTDGETARDCDVPARPGEPEKQPCSRSHPINRTYNPNYYHRPGYNTIFLGGGRSSPGPAPSTGTGHTTGTVSRGGFGGTGAHLSGGS